MHKNYPSHVSKEQFENIRSILENSKKKTKPRNLDLYEVFCAVLYVLKSDKIQEKITSIKILDEKTQGGNLKEGTIYVGTENGVYLTYPEGEVHKFDGLNFPITSIKLDGHGSAYVTNEQSEIFHLDLHRFSFKKVKNMESSDLEKEVKLYYNNDKKRKEIFNDWWYTPNNNKIAETFNLVGINPIDNFNKGEFLGDNDDFQTEISWGSQSRFGKKLNVFNGFKISENIVNLKYYENNLNWMSDRNTFIIQPKTTWWDLAYWFEYSQSGGLSFYWEKNNYYL